MLPDGGHGRSLLLSVRGQNRKERATRGPSDIWVYPLLVFDKGHIDPRLRGEFCRST